jgi:HTH-type transcriptional regulator/antitoxin HigA
MDMKAPVYRGKSDYAVPPGETIKELLEYNGMTKEKLSVSLQVPVAIVDGLISGKAPITAIIAQRLEAEFGVSSQFWLSVETDYRADLLRLKK